MVDVNGQVEIRDFTLDRLKTRKFKIDADVFDAVAVIPLGLMKQLLTAAEDVKTIVGAQDIDVVVDKVRKIMELLLVETAYERFDARLTDRTNPIGIEHVGPLLIWLVEGYAVRPTQPSPPSSDGSSATDTSTSSTAGALDTAVSAGLAIPFPGLISSPTAH